MGTTAKTEPTSKILCEEIKLSPKSRNVKLEKIWWETGTKNAKIAKIRRYSYMGDYTKGQVASDLVGN